MSDVERRDYELADSLVTGSSEQLKAMGDPLRKLICDLVLERAMSVTDLAERVGRPKGTVAYHVDILVEAGLLQVVRTRKVRAIEERFYGRVARTFVLPGAPGQLPFIAEVTDEADLDRLDVLAAADPDGVDAAHWGTFTYRRVRLPHERVAEYTRRLNELALEFVDEPRGGDVEFGMYIALFPTNRQHRNPPPATQQEAPE
jgi:DNA-binding transcriptional ArsR family regulator